MSLPWVAQRAAKVRRPHEFQTRPDPETWADSGRGVTLQILTHTVCLEFEANRFVLLAPSKKGVALKKQHDVPY